MSETTLSKRSLSRKELATKAVRATAAGLAIYAASGELLGKAFKSGSAQAAIAAPAENTNHRIVAAYLETDLSNSQYAAVSRLNLKGINRLILSFANADSTGEVTDSGIATPVKKIVGKLAAGSEVMLAIGGANADPQGWKAALKNPAEFVKSTKQTVAEVQNQIGHKISGVDIDFEYPSDAQSKPLVTLMKDLRQGLPGEKISMAIPPTEYNLHGYNLKALTPLVDNFDVMAYDYTGSWAPNAGDEAPGPEVIQDVSQIVQTVGTPAKIVVGFPGYGYDFVQKKPGRNLPFTGVSTISYNTIPASAVKDNNALMASEATIKGDWVSVDSPNMIKKIDTALDKKYPSLGGAFYWELTDLVQAHLKAVQ